MTISKTYYVYGLINPLNNQLFYIGKGSGNRAQLHAKFKDSNNNLHKDNTIKQIQREGLEPLVVFLYDGIIDESQAYELERAEINRIGIENLTNICDGPSPPSRKGYTQAFSVEHRQKLSAALKGKPKAYPSWSKGKTKLTDDRINKMAMARAKAGNEHQRGKTLPAETRQKIRSALQGRVLPSDQREKMSLAKKGRTWEDLFGEKNAQARRQAAKNRPSALAKSVTTPAGIFSSVISASMHYGVTDATVRNRCLSDQFIDWYYN